MEPDELLLFLGSHRDISPSYTSPFNSNSRIKDNKQCKNKSRISPLPLNMLGLGSLPYVTWFSIPFPSHFLSRHAAICPTHFKVSTPNPSNNQGCIVAEAESFLPLVSPYLSFQPDFYPSPSYSSWSKMSSIYWRVMLLIPTQMH